MTDFSGIDQYILTQSGSKQKDLLDLHNSILQLFPDTKLRFLDGKNSEGKVISNPNVGYGSQLLKYADNTEKEFYKVGISANAKGISVYILGLPDKMILKSKFSESIGKASITGYCIRFSKLEDVNKKVLLEAIKYGMES